MKTKICIECSKEFIPNVHNQIYCSKKCKDKARSRRQNLKRPNNYTVPRVCTICGKEFIAHASSQKTCSEECRDKLKKQNRKKYNDTRLKKSITEKKCRNCGNIFIPSHFNNAFCSEECKITYQKNKSILYNKKHYQDNKEYYKQIHSEYYLKNKERTLKRNKKNRAIRQTTDPDFVIKKRIRERIRDCLKRYGLKKNFHTFELLGYTSQDLYNHLESLFEIKSKPDREPLSWENMGTLWHIEHKKPCASFKFVNENGELNEDEIKECWKLENLESEYADINLSKSSKYNGNIYVKGEVVNTY